MGWYDPPDDPPMPKYCEDECPLIDTDEEYKLDECACDPEKCEHLAIHIHYAYCLKHKSPMWEGQCEGCFAEAEEQSIREAEEYARRYATGRTGN